MLARTDRGIRVLLIDDHQLAIDALRSWLHSKTAGIDVAASLRAWDPLVPWNGDGPEQYPAAAADVAVLGNVAGGPHEGARLTSAIKGLITAGLHVVVLAGTPSRAEIRSVLAAGAMAYASKASAPDAMVAAIRAAAGARRYLTPDVEALASDERSGRVTITARERRLVELYLGPEALSRRSVAAALGISEQTVKAHLRRIRQRYATAGIDVGNAMRLRQQLREDGWLN
jgi:two-component system nitrate/nitrite response regulator NarL